MQVKDLHRAQHFVGYSCHIWKGVEIVRAEGHLATAVLLSSGDRQPI